jgi:hypothetical protein
LLRLRAEQALTEPEHRASAERSIAGLLDRDLPDLAGIIGLAPADLRADSGRRGKPLVSYRARATRPRS